MSAYDISRFSFDPRKHYHSVRMQQGRVLTDDDWNENERIDAEEQRRTRSEVIGPYGSPDQGFKIAQLRVDDGQIDFDILPGTLHLGGLRLEMEAVTGEDGPVPETFRTQRDWLQLDTGAFGVPKVEELTTDRFDLVYLEAWQQPVSAVEDEELFEVALGGPDTTTRIRNMRRVQLATATGERECHAAWQALVAQWAAQHLGTVDAKYERVPQAQLQVSYNTEGETDDLCTPSIEGGYLGAENQAIRVQIVDGGHFTWGFDNGAPLYRIEVSGDAVTMLTLPRDPYHWPLAGQVVEILPWSALLPNGEKIAETRGHLSRVLESFNPDTHQLTLATPLPANFGLNWTSRSDSEAIGTAGEVPAYYLRVWNRGAGDTSDPAIAITPGTAQALGTTGISVTFSGPDFVADDHWVIAARPETRDQVVPWVLESGAAPQGIRRFFAPLAVIRWSVVNGEVEGAVIRDCRKTFRPLTDLEGCCTFHVGDGVISHGDFNSIEEALQNLPEAGGQICVLPGQHVANVSIANRQNIRIHGCGDQSIVAPHPKQTGEPILRIANSQNLTIDGLHFAAYGGTAIYLEDRVDAPAPSSDMYIHHNRILAFDYGIFLQVDDVVRGQNHVHIAYNRIAIIDQPEGKNGIFCLADEVLIERNKIVVVPQPDPDDPNDPRDDSDPPGGVFDPCDNRNGIFSGNFSWAHYLRAFFRYTTLIGKVSRAITFQALGGIQIGGGSEQVRIIDNEIIGGAGHGVTMGHLPKLELADADFQDLTRPLPLSTNRAFGQHPSKTGFLSLADLGEKTRAALAAQFHRFLYEIAIEGNRIAGMGLSGIGIIAFFDPASKDVGLIVHVENLTIYRNHISHCAQQIPAEIPGALTDQVGFGGIALASCENARIEENRIEDNGLSYINPISGMFILNGEDVEISRNRILNNGPRTSRSDDRGLTAQARRGTRGGIVIGMAFKRQFVEAIQEELVSDGVPAAKIHDNIVVQPLGQALYLRALGPVSIVGNQFTSHEMDLGHPLSLIAGAVLVFNLGISKDLMRMSIVPALRQLANLNPKENTQAQAIAAAQRMIVLLQYLPSGNVLFANNQTTLDLRNQEIDLCLSAQLIASLDDIGFSGNQSECKGLAFLDVRTSQLRPIDLVLCNTVLAGVTVRTTDNRFQEGFTLTSYSLLSIGLLNTTLGNQSTHCLLTYGTREAEANNLEGFLSGNDCGRSKDSIGSQAGIGASAPKQQVTYTQPNAYRQ
ncbi:MAG: hypothetical protein OHK0039_41850 [Bacteroidia bacterium]